MTDPDADAAVEIATARLAEQFRSREESDTSDVGILTDHTNSIKAALEKGEEPSPDDIEIAIQMLEIVKRDLRDVARLFGRNPWEYGFCWGDLTEEEQAEIQEREADD